MQEIAKEYQLQTLEIIMQRRQALQKIAALGAATVSGALLLRLR
jgi:hypothetical protein